MIFADTSFLISLYGRDVNTPAAKELVSSRASLDAGAKEFWTFDGRQGSLAQAVGLLVGP